MPYTQYVDGNLVDNVTAAGERTKPLQPAFLAYNSASDANVTGNGTKYTVVFNTEVFDQNSDYNNGTGVFTASVTGRYQFSTEAYTSDAAGSTTNEIFFDASNRTWSVLKVGQTTQSMSNSALVDMDAADTISVSITISGLGGDTADIWGGADAITSFGGFLAI